MQNPACQFPALGSPRPLLTRPYCPMGHLRTAFLRIVSLSVGVLCPLQRPRRASQVPRRSFSDHAVLSDPAGVSGNLALPVAYCSLPGFTPCRPPGLISHEAQSLHFRYGLVVALSTLDPRHCRHRPKARFPVSG